MKQKTLKEKLIVHLEELLDDKIQDARFSIESAKESRDSDTKSSAGDKFETGRAMMQFELEKNELQLSKAIEQKVKLQKIDCNTSNIKIGFGSLVETNRGNYFLAIAMGKIMVEKYTCFSISLASPIGILLQDKKEGHSFEFQGKTYEIIKVC